MTPSGIEAATFRFVAQHLNHCATASPDLYSRPQFFGINCDSEPSGYEENPGSWMCLSKWATLAV